MRKLGVIFLVLLLVPLFAHAQDVGVTYSVYMAGEKKNQSVGWSGYFSDGESAGTVGQKRAVEAIKVKLSPATAGSIRYDTFVVGVGWLGWQSDDADAGWTGRNKTLEAIKVELTGALAEQYNVKYRVHMSSIGWTGWSSNGEAAGVTGKKRQIEAIEIVLEKK